MPLSYPIDVVRGATQGDRAALERLLDACTPEVIRLTTALGGPAVNAEDAAQDVLVVLIRRVGTLRDPGLFGPWLFAVVRKVVARHRRAAWVRHWVPGVDLTWLPGVGDPEQNLDRTQRDRRVRALVASLPAGQAVAVRELSLEGGAGAEVAERHGVPHPTLRRQRQKGEERLREMVLAEPELLPPSVRPEAERRSP